MLGPIGREKLHLYQTTSIWYIYATELINSIIMESDNSKTLTVLSGVSMQAKF
jgi:hypothetical protein